MKWVERVRAILSSKKVLSKQRWIDRAARCYEVDGGMEPAEAITLALINYALATPEETPEDAAALDMKTW